MLGMTALCPLHPAMGNAILKHGVLCMEIMNLAEEEVRKQARQQFSNACIQLERSSLFVPGCEEGRYRCDCMQEPLYISTSMGYHEVLEHGNRARVKVEVLLVFVKQDPYEVIYEGKKCAYVAKQEGERILFQPYESFLEWIPSQLHPLDEAKA